MEKITWDYIVNTAPDIIKEILGGLKSHKENPEYHPEGNAYEHIRIVTERLIQTGDMDLVMAGFFHDLGKLSTAAQSEEGDWNSSHGHENVSSQLVLRYKDWIGEMGANPYVVNEIVKNHMRIKFGAISKKDKDRLERYTIFQKLTQFMDADNMKKPWQLNEGLNLPKQSGSKQFDNVTVFYKLLPQDEATRRYNVQRPIQLTYLIDGEPIPDSVSDPKFHEMLNKLEPIFKEKIQPYFERLGYTLWSY